RLCRQLRPRTGTGRRLLPPFDGFVNRLHARLGAFSRRKMVDLTAVETVTNADLELLEAVQDVQLGEGEAVDAAGADGLPHQHGVEPTAAPAPPGPGAELAAAVAYELADGILLLGGERTFADAGRIGLADAEHVADGAGTEAATDGRLRGHGVRGGHERVGAVVDIEQRALSS